ncbi:hypothetical protein FOXYS1_4515 [Fusarium oxysporum]|uniref:Nephrocystin 3-like N-terminal domain-containing protein n=1 Tax=Fusarium oxysporum TaxID=5507 RepID=A0A8H5AHI5_FUSOX|nr:hypothetical protein FOXYS1_4515 [Fusarium oxysporum]
MAASSHKNFRLRGIPHEYETRGEVCSLIQKIFALEPNASPTVYSLALSPTDRNSKIATLSFPSIPDCLSDRLKTEWFFNLSEGADIDFGRSLVFDTHFTGFTPFHRASDKDCHIDVIAVCGLGGHALGSFKEKNGRFVWLRDALPSDIPNARIFTYGYNSQLVDSQSFQSLTDLGRALQVDLEDIRDSDQSRSILFIGHSLGGLVIKETVRILKEEPLEPDSSVLSAISGFAFFGVPHRGLAVQCLVPLVKDNPNRALLESLNRNSSLLDRLQIEFDKISTARSFSVVSFYETEKSPTGALVNGKWEMSGSSEVLVEVVSATCGCQKQHPINRNHSEMVKYSGVHDQIYRRVIVSLRPILRITRGRPGTGTMGRGPQVFVRLSGDEQECLKSLSFPEQEHRYSEISYASDTCDWLLEDHNFQKWMNTARGLFWIKGCPGTGKSVLMKFAVDTMNRRKSGDIIASFFIHGRGIPLQRTPLGIFRALLNSLLLSFPTYLAELTEVFQDKQKRYGSYEQKNGWQWNEKELEIFLSRLLIEGAKEKQVVIFIDALDECGEEDAKRLLVSLKSLAGNAKQEASWVRICFSSRHFPILGHETMARVYVEEKNDQDIRLVIEGRLKELQPVEKRRQIEKEIMLKAHGGFQWAMLITNMILDEDATGARTENLLNMISTTPPDLDDLYDFILRGATKDKHKQMEKLFQWVVYTKRPLSAQELREALATDQEMTYTTVSELRARGNWSDCVSQFEMRVRHISRGLVEFQNRDVYEQYEPGGEEWSREAQFIHQSAADFVAQKFLTNIEEGSLSRSPAGAGHFEISRSFLRYLTLEEILNGNDLSREKLSATFPLMPYGVTFLLDHIRGVEEEAICQADLVTLIQWNQPERLRMLARIWRIMDPEGTHAPRGWPFLGASRESSNLDAEDLEGNTPLQLALREDRQELALMILHRSRKWQIDDDAVPAADRPSEPGVPSTYLGHVNNTNFDGDTSLSLAVSIRADEIIQSLIDAGAEIKHEKSLVFYAISQRNKALVSQLIKGGSELEGAVFFATQCLIRANDDDHNLHELLKILLQAGGNTRRFTGVEIDDYSEIDKEGDEDEDEEAIFVAVRGGNTAAVSLLLSHSCSANLRDHGDRVPIRLAIERGQVEIARVLFRDSPYTILTEDVRGMTDLGLVIKTSQVDLALLFVEESRGILPLQELLYRAVEMNQLEFVDILLQRDADIIELANQSWQGRESPFLLAVYQKDDDMVDLLLHTGRIDIGVMTRDGKTPFFLAVQLGCLGIAKLLLDTGKVGFNLENFEEISLPLRSTIDEFQVMNKACFSSQSRYSTRNWSSDELWRCFWWTIICGKLRMTKLFLEESWVDVHKEDAGGQTPLLWAIQSNKEDVVKVLLSSDRVNVSFRDKTGRTAFWLAVENRMDSMIQLLLGSARFDIQHEDDETAQMLFWWGIGKGNSWVISILHDSGKYGMNMKDPSGRTPLIYAAETCAEETVRVLLTTGKADIHAVDNRGDTALSIAVKRGYRTIVDLLSTYVDQSSGIAIRVAEH